MEEHKTVGSRVILGIILIAIGLLYLGQSFLPIEFEVHPFSFILLLVGIIIMLNSHNKLFGAIVFIFGIVIYFSDQIEVWPFFFILWGIYIIFKQRTYRHRAFDNPIPNSDSGEKKDFRNDATDFVKSEKQHYYDSSIKKDFLDDISVFGGGHKIIHSDNFSGGNVTAIFGGSEIDLTQCKLAPGENVIDVVIIFGGTTIVVPNNWDVVLNVTPLFGGFSNKKSRYVRSGSEPTATLIIKGVVLFGGGEVKSY